MQTEQQQAAPQLGQRVRVPSISEDVTATVKQTYEMPKDRWIVTVRFDRPVPVGAKTATETAITMVGWERCEVTK